MLLTDRQTTHAHAPDACNSDTLLTSAGGGGRVTAGRERLTLTLIASFASPNKSSIESIMLWSWMSCMEESTPELSMMRKKGRKMTAPHKGRQTGKIVWPAVAHEHILVVVRW